MQPYLNLSGDSGVVAYEIAADFILVRFTDGNTYGYTARSAGAANIAQMKMLAQIGLGLSTFINRNVKTLYAWKR
jgi:hypothetical protein